MQFVVAFLCCLAPSLALYFWLRSLQKDKPGYRDSCGKALGNGFLAALPVVAAALVLDILGNLLGIADRSTVVGALYRCFVLFALTEEASKFLMFRRTLKNAECAVSWFDTAVFMTLVGCGFGILENVFYSIDMGLGQAVVRGLGIAHGGYGFIMGYFWGKGAQTGRRGWYAVALVLPYLLHGLYDFALSSALGGYDVFAVVAVTLAALDYVLLVVAIVFFARRKADKRYTAPLGQTPAPAPAPTATNE